MTSCVQERVYIQDTLFYIVGIKQFLKQVPTKLKAAGKISLKQVTFYWAYALPDLGPKDQKRGPEKAVAPVSKSAFPIGQIGHNIVSLISKGKKTTTDFYSSCHFTKLQQQGLSVSVKFRNKQKASAAVEHSDLICSHKYWRILICCLTSSWEVDIHQ